LQQRVCEEGIPPETMAWLDEILIEIFRDKFSRRKFQRLWLLSANIRMAISLAQVRF
jgi:hypothetical protein